MVITRTPFRISFAGGGSDLPSYYCEEPGAVLSTAIDKYMYISVMERFGSTYRIGYSKTELVDRVEEIQHPLVRECIQSVGLKQGLEVVSMANLPAQSGMGSSSSFTVGLLHALRAFAGRVSSPELLASEACRIEIERAGEPIGKQDQYIAAYGGMQFIRFFPGGHVSVDPVVCTPERRLAHNQHLVAFFTGQTRSASEVLTRQNANAANKKAELRELCALAEELRGVVSSDCDLREFGRGLHRAWEIKKSLESSITSAYLDEMYECGRKAGALGGKVLGAGAGGFMLFFCEPDLQDRLRAALGGFRELPFRLEPEGSKIIHISSHGE